MSIVFRNRFRKVGFCMKRICIFVILLCVTAAIGAAESFSNFVVCSGDKLLDGDREIRFVSWNIPNLHYIEDNLPFEETNPWRLPNEFEIRDALYAVRQAGGQVVRIYTLSVRRTDDTPDTPRHVLGPGEFNEEAFQSLDLVLKVAHETGIRVIIPFVDNWKWFGGRPEYAGFRGKDKDAFWTDRQIIADFKQTIHYVLNRKNVYTGIQYKDDKAVFAWETGNELESPQAWTDEIAKYIKSIDKNHLVIDGYHSTSLRKEQVDSKFTDILTTHHYEKNADKMIENVKKSTALARGKKPYFIGEFGFIETEGFERFIDTVIEEGCAGALIWSLRFRNRDGGFYWHSEPWGGDLYKAYFWPGFDTGLPYDEKNVCRLMQTKAFEVQGKTTPPLQVPPAPVLLPVKDAGHITWQGSVGAEFYTVQRANSVDGPWEDVESGLLDSHVQYRSLYNDESVPMATSCYYRVLAANEAGYSPPSNVSGPVWVEEKFLIDICADLGRLSSKEGDLALKTNESRKFKEDAHRVHAKEGAVLIYEVPGEVVSVRVDCFFSSDDHQMMIETAAEDELYSKSRIRKRAYYSGEGDYNYWRPVGYRAWPKEGSRLVKISCPVETQIGHIEISYR